MPCIFIILACLILWHKHWNKRKQLEVFKVTPPPARNPVEQPLLLQETISQFETLVQEGNIVLLKLRVLLFALLPRAALVLIILTIVFVLVPLNSIIMLVFLEVYTREMPLRKASNEKLIRRLKEWWVRIPAAPVQLIKPEDDKKKK
ncbi:uncharacterized protein LOC18431230 [Amborella trichopoda]|uniref:Uncharacterized protein n=1 Tax=Amborella trichopoda TaxID=13333 RepID=W1P660_AMBTC|nr:uncharacterized protein LOC18431230 [Amborella trichopoda]ERN03096.1 hypothetical protein AMTR_s00003p00036090 [Amborella trichopoda]|eukprot:XP_020521264.1 uncharacterized protein LOC18431230 [Amborella trichopoda]